MYFILALEKFWLFHHSRSAFCWTLSNVKGKLHDKLTVCSVGSPFECLSYFEKDSFKTTGKLKCYCPVGLFPSTLQAQALVGKEQALYPHCGPVDPQSLFMEESRQFCQ